MAFEVESLDLALPRDLLAQKLKHPVATDVGGLCLFHRLDSVL
ncbi:MAG: hypothetical protein ACFBZ8_00295 [Opitutales bacterium]